MAHANAFEEGRRNETPRLTAPSRAGTPLLAALAIVPAFLLSACGQVTWEGSGFDAGGGTPRNPGTGTGVSLGDASVSESVDGDSLLLADGFSGTDGAVGTASTTLKVTVRDFKFYNRNDPQTNADFQNVMADDHATPTSGPNVVGTIVAETLGADGKPVYKNMTGMTVTTHGPTFFNQWYNDVPGVNITQQIPLQVTRNAQGTYGYDSLVSGVALNPPSQPTKMWFPIDDGTPFATTFGNQGQLHNYAFTTELHTVFHYAGGETFSFSGDDDVFVFINGKLVIDLGGVHVREQASVQLDSLGLTPGQTYPLDLFNAERHTTQSNMSFTTTLNLQPPAQ